MKKKRHPAFDLFERLFNEAAEDPGPVLPGYFVQRNIFHRKCREAGIDCPEGFIAAMQWEEEIGLQKFVRRVIRRYQKKATQPKSR